MSKIVLVTGATDGIGKMTAQRLAAEGYEVIVHGRDQKRVDQAIAEIKKQSPATLHACVFDLGSLADVKAGAQDLLNRFPKLDILLNNAGTFQKERRLSKEGFELTMAINHLGPTLLTLLLKPSLKNSPAARVIFVSSVAHNRGQLNPDNYNFEASFGAYEAYATSKLANVITTRKLADAWRTDGIPIYSLHPGVITTKLLKIGFNVTGASVSKGSNTSVYLATEDLPAEFNGEYFDNSQVESVSALAKDRSKSDAFWTWTMSSLQPFLSE